MWKSGPLYEVRYERVIIDEAHNMRNHNTIIANFARALQTTYRWVRTLPCVLCSPDRIYQVFTGTPILNGKKDLFALYRFLRMNEQLFRLVLEMLICPKRRDCRSCRLPRAISSPRSRRSSWSRYWPNPSRWPYSRDMLAQEEGYSHGTFDL